MKYESFIELTKKRRSIRKFKPDPLTTEQINNTLEAGRHGPSGFNCQLWEFVVVQSDELRDAIVGFINDARPVNGEGQPPSKGATGFATAPVFILLYGDPRVRTFGPPHVRADDNYWKFIISASLACSFQQMALAAASLGFGSMWVSTFHRLKGVDEKTRELLNIPGYLELFEMMAIGYPDEDVVPKRMWPLDKIVHWDKCKDNDFKTDKELDEWFMGK